MKTSDHTDTSVFSRVEILDTWNNTVTPVRDEFTVKPNGRYRLIADPPVSITLPGTPYLALRIRASHD